MATGIETQVVQGLAGIATLALSAAIATLTNHAKAWLKSHTSSNVSTVANDVIDGVGKVADSVVHDFNDRILREAQTNGVLTPELFNQVKTDAVRSVMDQAGSLVQLGTQIGADVQGLAFSMVAQSFNKLGIAPSVRPSVPAPAAAPATTPAPSVPPAAASIGTAQA